MLRPKTLLLLALTLCVVDPLAATFQQCPTGQHLCTIQVPTAAATVVSVPATTGAMSANFPMRRGMRYRLSATGTIRVGMPFEGDTTPDGWYTQDVAGSGFPAPESYKFSLLVRIGQAGEWRWVGTGNTTIALAATDPDPSEMFFGINDNRLNDNTGAFTVTIVELAPDTACCPNQNVPATTPFLIRTRRGTPAKPVMKAVAPCGTQTPDGREQSFMFDVYCFSSYNRTIPIEACSREDAHKQALTFVAPPCYLNEITGKPVAIEPRNPDVKVTCAEQLFKFCVRCDSVRSTVSAYGCTADDAQKKILGARPSICSIASAGDCPP